MNVFAEKIKEEIVYEEYSDGVKIIPHSTLEDIMRRYPRFEISTNPVHISPEMCLVECRVTDKETGETVLKVGESNPMNLETEIARKFPGTIAYQRAIDRAIVAILGLGAKFYSDQEIDRAVLRKAERVLDESPRKKRRKVSDVAIDDIIDDIVEEIAAKDTPAVVEVPEPIEDSYLGPDSMPEDIPEEEYRTEEEEPEDFEESEDFTEETNEESEAAVEEVDLDAIDEADTNGEAAEISAETGSSSEEWFDESETPAEDIPSAEEEGSLEVEEIEDTEILEEAEDYEEASEEASPDAPKDDFDESYFDEDDIEDDSYATIEPPKAKEKVKKTAPKHIKVGRPDDTWEKLLAEDYPDDEIKAAAKEPEEVKEPVDVEEDVTEEESPEPAVAETKDDYEDLLEEDLMEDENETLEAEDDSRDPYEKFLDEKILFGALGGKKVRDVLGTPQFKLFMQVMERQAKKPFMKLPDEEKQRQAATFIRYLDKLKAV